MDSEGAQKIFAEIPPKLIFLAAAIAIAVFVAFHYFGRADAGRIAAFSVVVLVGIIAKCRPLWGKSWFWIVLLCITTLHTTIIMIVPWPDPHYPALIIAPFSFVDYFLMIALIRAIATHRRALESVVDSGEYRGHYT